MIIRLYKTNSDPNDVDKVLSAEINIEVELKGECSITRPQLLICKSENNFYAGYNYLYIPDFKRYYYIDSITLLPGGYIVLSASVDVLMSYRSQIRGLNCLIERQEYIYNPYIADNYIAMSQGTKIKAIDCGQVGDDNYTTYLTTIGG